MATAGPDIIIGTNGANTLSGLAGNDRIYGHAAADPSPTAGAIHAVRVGTGFGGAVTALSAPGDPDHLYVITKDDGVIHRLDPATGASTVFLDIPPGEMSGTGERGLLGLAFHPDYAVSGADGYRKFYVHLTNAAGNIEVREYQSVGGDPPTANLATRKNIIAIDHPTHANHNGGSVIFGPDGYLYIPTGDGGGGGDPDDNAQDTSSLLGKLLRIDVDGDDFVDPDVNYAIPAGNPFASGPGADEVWAIGLRNPWRATFDSLTGDLYIGDVGQGQREEVDFQAAGTGAGANYGWDIMEGTVGPGLPGSVLPIFEYDHDQGVAVTGGYVYRGPGTTFAGSYFVGDFGSARLWTMSVVNGRALRVAERTGQIVSDDGLIDTISSFGTDGSGRIYVVTLGGSIFRLDFASLADDVGDRLYGGQGNDRLYGGVGNDLLVGGADNDFLSGGYGIDKLNGGGGNDVMIGGWGADTLVGGPGNDTYLIGAADTLSEAAAGGRDLVKSRISFVLGANLEDLQLIGSALVGTGNALANIIRGTVAGNILSGRAGNDLLNGGRGTDTLTGGGGSDTFVFNTLLDGVVNVDTVVDFSVSSDTIRIDNAVFTGLAPGVLPVFAFFIGAAAHDKNDRIVYNATTGDLTFDADGSLGGAAVRFAVLDAGLALTNADFFVV